MTTYAIEEGDFNALQGKTILLIGGATGIGRSAIDIALKYGANLAVGDWNEEAAKPLEAYKDRALFRKCDVSNWDNVLDLFQAAHDKFGVIHSVLSNAGINTHEDLTTDKFDPETGRLLPPSLKSVDVNLTGHLYVTKCALHFFGKWPQTQCQLVMTASAGAFFPAPPIYVYCAAKSGVLGLMRGLRSEVVKKNATVNVVAPWFTLTPMAIASWIEKWTLPKNSPEGVARGLFLPVLKPEINGKAFFVSGNEMIEFEDSLHDAQPAWMGQPLCDQVRAGQEILLGLEN